MKHIENINEWFGTKDGDDFAEKLLNIVEKESPYITKLQNRYGYIFTIDDINYEIGQDITDFPISSFIQINNNDTLKISGKYYGKIKKLYKEQMRQKEKNKLNRLPDISDVGRAAKKYNL